MRITFIFALFLMLFCLFGCHGGDIDIVVADVVGMSRIEAEQALSDAGLVVGRVTENYSDSVPQGAVISQIPGAGSRVKRGTTVALEVSLGPITGVRIGAIMPLTGTWAPLGRNAAAGLELALDQVNRYLVNDGLRIDLLVRDSSGDPALALAALGELAGQGVKTVIGPVTSGEAAAMVAYADAHDLLLISPSSTAVSLALPDHLYRSVPNDTHLAQALALIVSGAGYRQLFPVYLDDVYGNDLVGALREQAALATPAFQVPGGLAFAGTTADFNDLAAQLEAAVAGLSPAETALLLIGREADALALFRSAGADSPLAGFKWFASNDVIRQPSVLDDPEAAGFALKSRLEGFTFSWATSAPTVPRQLAAALVANRLNEVPSATVLTVWDALWFVAEALRTSEGAADSLAEQYREAAATGISVTGGAAELDVNGDMTTALYSLFRVSADGRNHAVWLSAGEYVHTAHYGPVLVGDTTSYTEEVGEVVIGAVLPLSGSNADLGRDARSAMQLALEQVNSYARQVEQLGLTFRLDVRDSGSDPATALAQVRALDAAGVKLLLGPIDSSELMAVADYVAGHDMIVLSTTSTAPSLSLPDRIIRLNPDDTRQARALSRLITAKGIEQVVLLHGSDIYGRDLAQAFEDIFSGPVHAIAFEPESADFSAPLLAAQAAVEAAENTESVAVLVVGSSEVVPLLEQVPQGPLTGVRWYGTDGVAESRALLSSERALAVALATRLTCSTYDIAGKQMFIPMLRQIKGELSVLLSGAPAWNEISAYDAVWLAANAYLRSGAAPDVDRLFNAFFQSSQVDSIGIGGFYIFDANQDQSDCYYAFYRVVDRASGPAWAASAYYCNVYGARDKLTLLEEP